MISLTGLCQNRNSQWPADSKQGYWPVANRNKLSVRLRGASKAGANGAEVPVDLEFQRKKAECKILPNLVPFLGDKFKTWTPQN